MKYNIIAFLSLILPCCQTQRAPIPSDELMPASFRMACMYATNWRGNYASAFDMPPAYTQNKANRTTLEKASLLEIIYVKAKLARGEKEERFIDYNSNESLQKHKENAM